MANDDDSNPVEGAPQHQETGQAVLAPEHAPDGAGGILSVIARAATDPAVDVEKLERLLVMQRDVLEREEEQAFNTAMQSAMKAMPVVVRDADNTHTKSKYARLETVNRAVMPTIMGHGFSLSFGTADSPLADHYRVTCAVSHVGGHTRNYFADVPADTTGPSGTKNKTATHGFGSTMAYGRRYLTVMIFNVTIADEDDDGNRAGNHPITEEQALFINDETDRLGIDKAKFCEYLKVSAIPEIRMADYGLADKALKAKEKENNTSEDRP